MEITPLAANTPRVLAHVRGKLDPQQAQFWAAVRRDLRAQSLELMLIAHFWPDEPADLPVLRVRNGFASVRRIPETQGWSAWLPDGNAFDATPYLARETLWHGPAENASAIQAREHAAHYFHEFYRAALAVARPVLTLIWNGHHPQEMILRDLCLNAGCPVHYIERAPIPGAIQVDTDGILADTKIARAVNWTWESPETRQHWLAVAANVAKAAADQTWWAQPASQDLNRLRKRLGIRPDQKVVLFAGQVDDDTQNLLFSPHFADNLSALTWFCAQLPDDDSVFVLGKHHPMARVPQDRYRQVIGTRGVWTSDVSLSDALALCTHVAAVNSTVLFEALMSDKPVLMLGRSLLSNKGIAYEPRREDDPDQCSSWLAADGFAARRERWQDFLAYLVATDLFSTREAQQAQGMRGSRELADYLARNVAAEMSVAHTRHAPTSCFLDAIAHWDNAAPRHPAPTGRKAIARALRTIARAILRR